MSFSQQISNIIDNFIVQVSGRYNINLSELRAMWNGGDVKTASPVPAFSPPLTPSFTPVPSRTTSVESTGGCTYILAKGANAGSVCGKKCAAGVANFCSAHKKYENQPPKAARTTPTKNVPPPAVSTVKSIIGKPIPNMPGYLHNTETNIVFFNSVAIGKFQDNNVTYMDEKDKEMCRSKSWTFDPEFLLTGKLSPPSLPTLTPSLPPPSLPPTLPPSLRPPTFLPSFPVSNNLPVPTRSIPKPPNFLAQPPSSLSDLQKITNEALGVPSDETTEETTEENTEENLEDNLEEDLEEEVPAE